LTKNAKLRRARMMPAIQAAEPPLKQPPSFEVLGVEIDGSGFQAVLDRVVHAPETRERLAVHFLTVHSLVTAQDDAAVRGAFGQGLTEPDGMPLVWLGRRKGFQVERVCGPDFMPALIAAGLVGGRSHYFYGGLPGVPEALARRFSTLYPRLRVVGTFSPPFREMSAEEDDAVVNQINAVQPDYVWVGLGAPKQDLWVASHRARLNAPVLLAVGAAFDFHGGRRRRAPRWMQKSGTEWLYRLASEPRRLAGRYVTINLRFAGLLLRGWLSRRFALGRR